MASCFTDNKKTASYLWLLLFKKKSPQHSTHDKPSRIPKRFVILNSPPSAFLLIFVIRVHSYIAFAAISRPEPSFVFYFVLQTPRWLIPSRSIQTARFKGVLPTSECPAKRESTTLGFPQWVWFIVRVFVAFGHYWALLSIENWTTNSSFYCW